MKLKTNLSLPLKRFPYWLRQSLRVNAAVNETKKVLCDLQVNTVCQSACCPNIYDCFSRKKCTFLILGRYCTRNCRFCAVETGMGFLAPPQKKELLIMREAVRRLEARNVIITSVTRDDLKDGGAGHFADSIELLRGIGLDLSIEVLVPDFLGLKSAIRKVLLRKPDIFSHNVETVPRLYKKVRPQADYTRSLDVLRYVKELDDSIITKSSLMVGFGETRREVYSVMEDLRGAGCEVITIGQYLRPAASCLEVEEFLHPEEFECFSEWAKDLRFKKVSSSPFTRSSNIN